VSQVADLIAFVASANSLCEDGSSDYIDPFGAQCLSVFRAIGLPSTVVFIRVRIWSIIFLFRHVN